MNYYEISILGRKLEPKTYQFDMELEVGRYVNVRLLQKEVCGVVVAKVQKPNYECKNIELVLESCFDAMYFEMAMFIAKYYVCEVGEALALFEKPYINAHNDSLQITSSVSLSEKQNEALEFLRSNQRALLFGDTGSGKTEIYMKRIDDILACGKSALFLLPEIALTPQILNRLKKHYGQSVTIWHSKITKSQKQKNIEALSSGKARILVGARSALFVPMQDLGLIIVDEEHDDSFKSESAPRYNAKDLAIWLATKKNIPIVLGSATPSLSSYLKFPYFRLRGGYLSGNKKFVFDEHLPSISPVVLSNIKNSIQNNMQSIVFLPTRANYKYIICNDCKKTIECSFCSVGMSLHKNSNVLKCHYCGWSQHVPQKCTHCGGELGAHRIGTVEAAQELQSAFPDLEIDILDKDAASTPKKLSTILNNFADNKTQVLVGTQMLSKGHDYGKVGLAVILGLDSVLLSSDFRAKEKALSLMMQLAGRAGRAGDAKILIQTQNREFFEKYLDNYESFLKDEILLRQDRYPPFVRFCRLIFANNNQAHAMQSMELVLNIVKQNQDIDILGYGEAAIIKIGGKHRFEILLRSNVINQLLSVAHGALLYGGVIDMDPLSFN